MQTGEAAAAAEWRAQLIRAAAAEVVQRHRHLLPALELVAVVEAQLKEARRSYRTKSYCTRVMAWYPMKGSYCLKVIARKL